MNNYAPRQAWIGFPLLSECCHFSDVRLKPNRRVLPPLEIHITISNIRDFNIISILPAVLSIISPGFSLFSYALWCTQSLLPGHFCTSTNLVTWAEPVAESYNPPGTVYYFSLYDNADHEHNVIQRIMNFLGHALWAWEIWKILYIFIASVTKEAPFYCY